MTSNIRDTLFIGHANPEDNDFTLWLQAKLINEGYKVECDLSFLIGGEEDYWKKLQNILEINSAKYLLVLSENSFKKQGVVDEWEQVKSIAKKNNISDFIYVLKVDHVDFDVRIGVNTKNHFRFDLSWATGLKKVLIKLFQDGVPKEQDSPLSVDNWSKNRYSTNHGIIEKEESYYSNWLPITNLPEKIYFFQYHNDTQSKLIEKNVNDFPLIRHDNYIITFSEEIPSEISGIDFEMPYYKRIEALTVDANKKYESNQFPNFDDLKRFIVRLVKDAIFRYLYNRNLNVFELSGNTKCFYYIKDQLEKDKVYFNYNNKSTYKQLVGEFKDAYWHYGISITVLLNPVLCYSLKAHLVFSDDGNDIWNNKAKLHKARRSKGKSFFNKEWRSLQLGFLASLSEDRDEIYIPLTYINNLNISKIPLQFYCDYGYNEPKTEGRIVPLDFIEDEEEFDFEEDEEYGESEEDEN